MVGPDRNRHRTPAGSDRRASVTAVATATMARPQRQPAREERRSRAPQFFLTGLDPRTAFGRLRRSLPTRASEWVNLCRCNPTQPPPGYPRAVEPLLLITTRTYTTSASFCAARAMPVVSQRRAIRNNAKPRRTGRRSSHREPPADRCTAHSRSRIRLNAGAAASRTARSSW